MREVLALIQQQQQQQQRELVDPIYSLIHSFHLTSMDRIVVYSTMFHAYPNLSYPILSYPIPTHSPLLFLSLLSLIPSYRPNNGQPNPIQSNELESEGYVTYTISILSQFTIYADILRSWSTVSLEWSGVEWNGVE